MADGERVLYAGTERGAAALGAASAYAVERVRPADAGERLAEHDCAVVGSDLDASRALATLEALVGGGTDAPVFVFSTAPIAEDAFDAGATDYVRAAGEERFSVLAHRIESTVRCRRRTHELETYERIVETAPDGIYTLDSAGNFEIVNRVFTEAAGVDPDALRGEPVEALVEKGVIDAETAARGRAHIDALDPGERVRFESPVRTPAGEIIVENNLATLPSGIVNITRNVTAQKEAECELAQQRDELETLNRINSLVQTAIASLIGETSQEAIERTVCERLVESDLYHGAWIGDVSDTNGAPRPRVTAGGVELPMDEITEGPVVTALESRSIQAVEDCRDTPGFSCSSDGSCSGLAVPLPWGSSSGVLVVCSGRSDAFSERERAAFGVLGTVLGAALPALRHQELLFGDEITELTFDVPDTHSAFVRASIAHACRIEDDDFVLTDGTGVHFVRVSDADPDAVLETLLAEEGFEDGRVVSQTDDGGTLALRHYGSSMVLLLIEQGARVTEAVSDCGETKVVAELPPGADVRRVVERAQASFPDAKLVGKRRIERPDAAAATFPGNAVEELTERQRGALRTAYRAGYYEWPRESTAEEVAATMGIASATLHQHLRAAERKLLGALFDARP